MKIECNYNYDDRVWVMENNKPIEKSICGIEVRVGKVGHLSGGVRIIYHFKEGFLNGSTIEFHESDVYKTKEDLMNNL